MPPIFVIKIPADGFCQAAGKGFLRLPAKLTENLSGINGIPEIMPRTVGHIGDLALMQATVGMRCLVVQKGTNPLYHIDI